jgi:hypothetical protein
MNSPTPRGGKAPGRRPGGEAAGARAAMLAAERCSWSRALFHTLSGQRRLRANGPGVESPGRQRRACPAPAAVADALMQPRTIGGVGPARGRGRGGPTRSHPEPGRETSQRRPVLRAHARGRGGRRGRTPPWQVASSCVSVVGTAFPVRRGVEQRQLVGLITRRSGVRIPPPLPVDGNPPRTIEEGFSRCRGRSPACRPLPVGSVAVPQLAG